MKVLMPATGKVYEVAAGLMNKGVPFSIETPETNSSSYREYIFHITRINDKNKLETAKFILSAVGTYDEYDVSINNGFIKNQSVVFDSIEDVLKWRNKYAKTLSTTTTDKKIAEFYNTTTQTLRNWKKSDSVELNRRYEAFRAFYEKSLNSRAKDIRL